MSTFFAALTESNFLPLPSREESGEKSICMPFYALVLSIRMSQLKDYNSRHYVPLIQWCVPLSPPSVLQWIQKLKKKI